MRRRQRIASKRGRGYHRSGPTGWMPDYSGTTKLGQCPALFKASFSMEAAALIAHIALTSECRRDLDIVAPPLQRRDNHDAHAPVNPLAG